MPGVRVWRVRLRHRCRPGHDRDRTCAPGSPLTPCDDDEGQFPERGVAVLRCLVASYALHHIRTPRAKLAFYCRCCRALRPGGALINGDCAPASTPRGFARDLDLWYAHLGKTFGSRARGRRVYESWASRGYVRWAVRSRTWIFRSESAIRR